MKRPVLAIVLAALATIQVSAGGPSTRKKASIRGIIAGMTEMSDPKVREFGMILDNDVLGFYDLRDKYDTPVKKEAFRKSRDYAEKASKLKKQKQKILSAGARYFYSQDISKLTYDAEKKGFVLTLYECRPDSGGAAPLFGSICVPNVPTSRSRDGVMPPLRGRELLLSVNKRTGLLIEAANRESLDSPDLDSKGTQVYVIFRIAGVVNRNSGEGGIDNGYYIVADTPRILMVNGNTGKIYYDRTSAGGKADAPRAR